MNYQSYRVLVIEDQSIVRLIIVNMLQKLGFKYIGQAADGAAGLLEIEQLPPDLIICDIEMKPLDGLSFLQVLRQSQRDRCPKVIFLTSHAEASIVARACALGVDAFVTKPVTAEQLRYQIDSVLAEASARPPTE